MKNLYLLISFCLTLVIILSLSFVNDLVSNKDGGPVDGQGGYAGGTYEMGRTCNTLGCHETNAATYRDGIIFSNAFPANGYLAGQTYQINIEIDEPGITKFGFQASPQNASGTIVGTMSNIGSQTQTIQNGAYSGHTHTEIGNIGLSPKFYSFEWTAPTTPGAGTLYFYATAAAANGDNLSSDDLIFFDTLVVKEDHNSGIPTAPKDKLLVNVFPNPYQGLIIIEIESSRATDFIYSIYDIQGESIIPAQYQLINQGKNQIYINAGAFASGIYFVEMASENQKEVRKIMKW